MVAFLDVIEALGTEASIEILLQNASGVGLTHLLHLRDITPPIPLYVGARGESGSVPNLAQPYFLLL